VNPKLEQVKELEVLSNLIKPKKVLKQATNKYLH